MEIDFKDLLDYLTENIEDFKERCDIAISKGYREHIMPSQCDRFLADEIYDKAEEYAEENELNEDEVSEFVADRIDDFFFES